MNIFATSSNPLLAARDLDDLRLNKMIIETAQILSTNTVIISFKDKFIEGPEPGFYKPVNKLDVSECAKSIGVYKPTHINHPCVIWARRSEQNFFWLLEYFQWLLQEWTYRGFNKHSSSRLLAYFALVHHLFPKYILTQHAKCTPGFEHIYDVHEAYREYLKHKWNSDIRKPKWTNREKPKWLCATEDNFTSTIKKFVQESNGIEGIEEVSDDEVKAHLLFLLHKELTLDSLKEFVSIIQPGSILRNRLGLNVRIGDYYPPMGGEHIEKNLQKLLNSINNNEVRPYKAHYLYEKLHPFTDGNGRSGRVIWLWMMNRLYDRIPKLSFLESWYRQSLKEKL